MSKLVLAGVALLQALQPTPETPCRLTQHIAIGCLGDQETGPENAADMYAQYGTKGDVIGSLATKNYLHRFNCIVLEDATGALGFERMGIMEVAEPTGTVRVVFVDVKRDPHRRVMWVAEPYFSSPCPRLKPS